MDLNFLLPIGGAVAAGVVLYWLICAKADADARAGMDPALRRVIDNDKKLTEYVKSLA